MTKSWSSEETQMKSLHQRPKAKTDINKVSILTVNTERERERERERELELTKSNEVEEEDSII